MGSINSRPLKAFVRYDGSGRIVAGSLILRKISQKWASGKKYKHTNAVSLLHQQHQQQQQHHHFNHEK